ncbi:MAG: hypothetical protein ABMB14_21485, partial [Myxococcota bacterium]
MVLPVGNVQRAVWTADRLVLWRSRDVVEAWDPARPDRALWSTEVPESSHHELLTSGGRVFVGAIELDLATGAARTHPQRPLAYHPGTGRFAVEVSGGVALVDPEGGRLELRVDGRTCAFTASGILVVATPGAFVVARADGRTERIPAEPKWYVQVAPHPSRDLALVADRSGWLAVLHLAPGAGRVEPVEGVAPFDARFVGDDDRYVFVEQHQATYYVAGRSIASAAPEPVRLGAILSGIPVGRGRYGVCDGRRVAEWNPDTGELTP